MILPEETRLRILLNGLILYSILTLYITYLLTCIFIRLEEIRANGTPNMVVMLIGILFLSYISDSSTHSLTTFLTNLLIPLFR